MPDKKEWPYRVELDKQRTPWLVGPGGSELVPFSATEAGKQSAEIWCRRLNEAYARGMQAEFESSRN